MYVPMYLDERDLTRRDVQMSAMSLPGGISIVNTSARCFRARGRSVPSGLQYRFSIWQKFTTSVEKLQEIETASPRVDGTHLLVSSTSKGVRDLIQRSTRTPSNLDERSVSKTPSHPSVKASGCSLGLAILAANLGRLFELRSSRQVSTIFGTRLKANR